MVLKNVSVLAYQHLGLFLAPKSNVSVLVSISGKNGNFSVLDLNIFFTSLSHTLLLSRLVNKNVTTGTVMSKTRYRAGRSWSTGKLSNGWLQV